MLLAIAEEGSVTRAAQKLGLSQSALSHQLVNIERSIGAPLFDRVGKSMKLTLIGERLRDAAVDLLERIARAEAAMSEAVRTRQKKQFRIATSCYSYYTWLAGGLADFLAGHPEIDLRFDMKSNADLTGSLMNDEADCVITAHPPKGPEFSSAQIHAQEVVAIIPRDHALAARAAKKGGLRWTDLAGETLMIHDLPSSDENRLRRAVATSSAKSANAPAIEKIQFTEAILALVRAGFGLGVLNRGSFSCDADSRELIEAALTPRYDRVYWAAWRKRNPHNLPVTEFLDAIRASCASP